MLGGPCLHPDRYCLPGTNNTTCSKGANSVFIARFLPTLSANTAECVEVLLKERLVRDSIERANDAEKRNPAQLFRAVEVHLFSVSEVDLFVVGNFPMAGADNSWFWVVRSAHKNPRVVLSATGYTLELLCSRTNGYRDIRSTWSNPNGKQTRIYKFNRARYKLSNDRWDESQ